jgi:predicted outer membrane protein
MPARRLSAEYACPTDAETFINQMAIAGKAEVELGKLATQRAQNADVKAARCIHKRIRN